MPEKPQNMRTMMQADLDQTWAETRDWVAGTDGGELFSLLQILDEESPALLIEAMQTNHDLAERIQVLAQLALCHSIDLVFQAVFAEGDASQ